MTRQFLYRKTAAPTVNDDTGDGYKVGDIWLDETNDHIYQAIDVSTGAAIWLPYPVLPGASGNVLTSDGTNWTSAAPAAVGLTATNIAPTTADYNAAKGKLYFADLSGLTANRNFVLPVPAVGDEIQLDIVTGHATYYLILIGAATVTINGGSAASEWKRIQIAGGSVHLIANSTTNWQVLDANLQEDSEIWLYNHNGYGSTNTKIRRWTTIGKNSGPGMTLTQSATDGDKITINETGLYALVYTDDLNASEAFGISLNSNQLTTGIASITRAAIIAFADTFANGYAAECAVILKLSKNDIVRCHTSGQADGATNARDMFRITQIHKYL